MAITKAGVQLTRNETVEPGTECIMLTFNTYPLNKGATPHPKFTISATPSFLPLCGTAVPGVLCFLVGLYVAFKPNNWSSRQDLMSWLG